MCFILAVGTMVKLQSVWYREILKYIWDPL